jgi:hypothetical protein
MTSTTSQPETHMQAPINILVSLARLHAADFALVNALELERDNAQLDYDRLKAIPGGATNDHIAMLLVMADERAFCARQALRAMTQHSAQLHPEDLGYDRVQVLA